MKAKLVTRVPRDMKVETGWPSNEQIEALGGKILIDREGERRVVEFNRVALMEGGLDAQIDAAHAAIARDPELRRQWEEDVRKTRGSVRDSSPENSEDED